MRNRNTLCLCATVLLLCVRFSTAKPPTRENDDLSPLPGLIDDSHLSAFDDHVPYDWTKDSRETSHDEHLADEKYNLHEEKTAREKPKHQADINTNELKKPRNVRIDSCVEKHESIVFPRNGNPAVFKREMTSLPERTAKEDLQSGSAHVKPRKQDTAGIPSDKSIMGERLRDAVAWDADINVRTNHSCVKNEILVDFQGITYLNYECKSHSLTCSPAYPLFNKCKPVKQYYAVMGRTLTVRCECKS